MSIPVKKRINIVDIPKLEGMDYFTQTAEYFLNNGLYTKLTPNPHPQSPFMQFWIEETKRIKYGMVRDDGMWIPGYFYFYLNYSPIWLTEDRFPEDYDANDPEAKRMAERVYTFPRIWDSDFQYFHYVDQAEKSGQHCAILKTRGRGYSFKAGAMLARNYYGFPGSRSYALAAGEEYLIRDGILNKAWDVLDWVDTHTAWRKERGVKNDIMHKRASYIDPKTGIEQGYKSEIIGVTLKNDPDKARGKRAKLILFEEAGKFPGLLKAWQIARPSVEQAKSVFGTMIAFGTGGTEGADFTGLEELFYRPEGYNIYPLENIWDIGREGTKCGLFIPEYMNREGFYDKNGNSDKERAKIEIEAERKKVKDNASDPMALTLEKAERPINPQEAILRTTGTIFPVADLKNILGELEANEKLLSSSLKGYLFINENGEPQWRNEEIFPLREFPIREARGLTGAIEVFEPPKEGANFGRYIAGCDPYDDDDSSTNSLGSLFVLDTFTDRIVCEYTGRPQTASEFYENCRRILKWYNASCNYENNKKGMFTYFDNKHSLHLLADTPKTLRDVENIKIYEQGNKSKGTNASQNVNKWGRRLIHDWMVEQAYDKPEGVMNMHTIRSVALLKEAILWNSDGNFDRISALGMLMILREDRKKYSDSLKRDRVKTKASDPFFTRMFKKNSINEILKFN